MHYDFFQSYTINKPKRDLSSCKRRSDNEDLRHSTILQDLDHFSVSASLPNNHSRWLLLKHNVISHKLKVTDCHKLVTQDLMQYIRSHTLVD